MRNFYESLRAFSEFGDFTRDQHFTPLPGDWAVVITDIRGSTKAIAEGRYKDVNSMGAAAIVVVRKAMGEEDFPFVFGGDGATMLVPVSKLPQIRKNLSALKALAKNNHQLELRVGIVEVSKLLESGKTVEVGKYELTPGKCIAVLRGPGISFAETLIKTLADYEVTEPPTEEADLSGLSCRWNPIPSKRGRILTIIVSSQKGPAVYLDLVKKFSEILPDGIEGRNPVAVEVATYKSAKELLREERKLHRSTFSPAFLARALEILFAVMVFKHNLPAVFFDAKKYAHSMRTHSDFRKFDDTLRMVIDCDHSEIALIEEYLRKKYEEGEIFYGTFKSDSSLMTCFVEGLGQGKHIHFIDAENGGYTAAAVGLKEQILRARG